MEYISKQVDMVDMKIMDGMINNIFPLFSWFIVQSVVGYIYYRPDPTYFERVKDEFKQKGITVDDIEERYKPRQRK